LSEEEIRRFLANMALSIHHINSHEIYHRDLKPANFLLKRLNDGKIYLYLNDFGIARIINTQFPHLTTSKGDQTGTL